MSVRQDFFVFSVCFLHYTHAKTTRQEIPTQVRGQEEDSEEASHIT